jgi:hypothetical protein
MLHRSITSLFVSARLKVMEALAYKHKGPRQDADRGDISSLFDWIMRPPLAV